MSKNQIMRSPSYQPIKKTIQEHLTDIKADIGAILDNDTNPAILSESTRRPEEGLSTTATKSVDKANNKRLETTF